MCRESSVIHFPGGESAELKKTHARAYQSADHADIVDVADVIDLVDLVDLLDLTGKRTAVARIFSATRHRRHTPPTSSAAWPVG